MFLASDGKCSKCGCDLEPGWHADHVHPYSKGGQTDVINGQALCPECNLRKGNKIMGLRDWQIPAYSAWKSHDKDFFLCEATPGSGKTIFALTCVKDFIVDRSKRVIIVCPTTGLKKQWGLEADKIGIQLNYEFDNGDGGLADDDYGLCTTYQSVAKQSKLFRILSSEKDTIVVFDEIHHAGDDNSWGSSIKESFERAKTKLSLSGTPFRSDNTKIPFVNYVNGISVPDYRLSYGDALNSDPPIVRPVYFPGFDGTILWQDRRNPLNTMELSDEAPDDVANSRLMAALDPDGGWMQGVLESANNMLDSVRKEGHSNAGGLVLANGQYHARAIRDLLVRICGESNVVVATSEMPDAEDVVSLYINGKTKWIVAVRLIAEGRDIPRLRVGVHATNYTTKLFFRQAVGRIVRFQDNIDDDSGQLAYYYIPSDPRFIALAKEISNEVNHVIEGIDKEPKGPRGPGGDGCGDLLFTPISSTSKEDVVVSVNGNIYSRCEMDSVGEDCRRHGIAPALYVKIADLLSEKGVLIKSEDIVMSQKHPTNLEKKQLIRAKCTIKARALAAKTNIEHWKVGAFLNKTQGISKIALATKEHLLDRLTMLNNWLGDTEQFIKNINASRF